MHTNIFIRCLAPPPPTIPTTSVPFGLYTWPEQLTYQTLDIAEAPYSEILKWITSLDPSAHLRLTEQLLHLIREAPDDSPPHPIPSIHSIMGPSDPLSNLPSPQE